jgi:apolipoprotein N-acyltransferase
MVVRRIISILIFFLLPVLSGTLLFLAFPNYHLDWLAWVAFLPLLLGMRGRRPWHALVMGWICGVIFFLGITPWWLEEFQSVSIFASGLGYLYLGLYFALFGLFLTLILARVRYPFLIAAPIWVAFEYLRSNLSFIAFPWVLLGHSQYLNLPLIQMASFTGVYGVSFLIVLANAAIADLMGYWIERKQKGDPLGLKNAPVIRGAAVLVIVLSLWITGNISLPSSPSGELFSVAVVQGNIPQKMKWKMEYREHILSQYENLTEEATKSKPQLIVWPETSTPGLILKDMTLLKRMVSIIRKSQTSFLVGSAEYPKFEKSHEKAEGSGNTALFFSPQGKILGQYIKIRLVPFGEYVPYEEIIPWPEFIVQKGKIKFDIAGTEETLFKIDRVRFGTLICWEVLFSGLTRNFVKNGADFVINITNEAWFGKIAFPYQMLSSCVFRAVENRVNLVRCANTGISCFIDPYGRVTGRVTNGGKDIFVSGALTQQIHISPPGTFYTLYGDVFVYGCIAFLMVIVVWVFVKGTGLLRRQKT